MPETSIAVSSAAWLAYLTSVEKQLRAASESSTLQQVKDWPPLEGIDVLCAVGLGELVAAHFLSKVEFLLRDVHINCFWAYFENGLANLPTSDLEATLLQALQELCSVVEAHCRMIATLTGQLLAGSAGSAQPLASVVVTLQNSYLRTVGALFLTTAKCSLSDLLLHYYAGKLAEFGKGLKRSRGGARSKNDENVDGAGSDDELATAASFEADSDDEAELMDCMEEGASLIEVFGEAWGQRLQYIANALRILGVEAVSEEAFAAVVCTHVQYHLTRRTQRIFDRHVLPAARAYVSAVPLEFLRLVLPSGEAGEQSLAQWRLRLDYYVYETVGQLRIGEMFDIVVDYPESLPAVGDIRDCLRNTNLHQQFITRFRAATQARLLHAGAATSDIIQQYVSTIKTLREVDPTGVLLEAVGEPIKEYLRGRRDTIRCIVTMLTDDTAGGEMVAGESLFDELGRNANDADAGDSDGEGEGDASAWEAALRWEPDPVDADPARSARSRRMHDIISMLVAIYGSKELFIAEYRLMLADKLLAKTDYDCDREIRTLELLKLRFGDTNLHNCEVMIKDMADSKRIHGNIRELPTNSLISPMSRGRRREPSIEPLTPIILSGLFWPPFQQDAISIPAQVQIMLDTYAAKYHSLKAPRKLVWKPHLGTVKLAITIGDRTTDFTVSPLQAVLIMAFQTVSSWRGSELAKEVGLPPSTLRRRIVFWVNQGVLSESRAPSGEYLYARMEQMAETGPGAGGAGAADTVMDDELTTSVATAEDQLQQEMAVYESFVMGMLTNFERLPLERIHNMLKMFVVDPPYDKTAEQLASFLSKLVAEEKLLMEAGSYKKR
ncbi:hypothetical protein WJX72_008627 [[Myrmecia] bisecta]|uniref:Anaphase-promoting complex subunit 2 n=1 Tax=[Myrmecia] bisecta TaxID=41462 RepID=A0AAW1QG02_9CHLO